MLRSSLVLLVVLGTFSSSVSLAHSVSKYCSEKADFVLDLRTGDGGEAQRSLGFSDRVTKKGFRGGQKLLTGQMLLWSDIFEVRGDSLFVDLSFPSNGNRNLLVGRGEVSVIDSNFFCGVLAGEVEVSEIREIVKENVFPFPSWMKVKTTYHKYQLTDRKNQSEYRTSTQSIQKE